MVEAEDSYAGSRDFNHFEFCCWLYWIRTININRWDSLSLRVLPLWVLKFRTNLFSFLSSVKKAATPLCHYRYLSPEMINSLFLLHKIAWLRSFKIVSNVCIQTATRTIKEYLTNSYATVYHLFLAYTILGILLTMSPTKERNAHVLVLVILQPTTTCSYWCYLHYHRWQWKFALLSVTLSLCKSV